MWHLLTQQTTERKSKKEKKRHKDLEIARELRKLWNMSVTVIPFMIGTLGTVPRLSERRLEKLEISPKVRCVYYTYELNINFFSDRVLSYLG